METYFDTLGFLTIAFILAVIIFAIVLLVYIYEMAQTRGRSVFYWMIFSLVLTPILGMILLACLGETEEKRRTRLFEDKEYLRMMKDDDWG